MLIYVPPWWFLAAAAALVAYWAMRVLGAHINVQMFVRVIQKVIREKNIPRAVKLSESAGDSPLAVATKAALLASVWRDDDESRHVGYRDVRQVPMDVVRARIRSRYDEAFTRTVAPLPKARLLALPSPFLTVAAFYYELSYFTTNWSVIGASAVCLLFWLYINWVHVRVIRSRNDGFDLLWPSFEFAYENRLTLDVDVKPMFKPSEASTLPSPSTTANPHIFLDVLEPGKPLRSIPVDQPIIKIGKFSSAHVELSAEGVSRIHAVIEVADGKATILDLGAERQTRVNGQAVNRAELSNGDVIGIGDAELVVKVDAAAGVTSSQVVFPPRSQ